MQLREVTLLRTSPYHFVVGVDVPDDAGDQTIDEAVCAATRSGRRTPTRTNSIAGCSLSTRTTSALRPPSGPTRTSRSRMARCPSATPSKPSCGLGMAQSSTFARRDKPSGSF